jgi:hypothetical protein
MRLNGKFSTRFYIGIILVIISIIVGKITQVTFLLYINNPTIMYGSIIIYLISWIPFLIGGWWIGKEYYYKIKRYTQYRFYHHTAKKAYHVTKRGTKAIARKSKNLGGKIKNRLKKKKNV